MKVKSSIVTSSHHDSSLIWPAGTPQSFKQGPTPVVTRNIVPFPDKALIVSFSR
ncbi:MAG: hypothetical protein OEW15_16010 [Nitrospirota bacterium]|nr:hypothetical protein [Nitrospirota bacterium]